MPTREDQKPFLFSASSASSASSEGSECTACRRDLEAFVDGALEEHRRRRVSRHLESCRSCATEEEGLRALSAALRDALPPVSCPPELAEGLLAIADTPRRAETASTGLTASASLRRFQPRAKEPQKTSRRWHALLAAASLVLAVGLTQTIRFDPAPPAPDAALPPEASLEQATAEAELALAYIGRVGRRIGETVRSDVLDPPHLRQTLGTAAPEATTAIEFEDRDHEPR